MIEVKIFDDGKLVEEKSGDYILLFSVDNEKIETFSTGGGPDMDRTFEGIGCQLAEIILDLGKEVGMAKTKAEIKNAAVARRILIHGRKYAAEIYPEEANEGSGQGVGSGMEPGEH